MGNLATPERLAIKRANMVEHQLRRRGIKDERVLEAMATIPREAFILEKLWPEAYADRPLPIGNGQTISQPYMVAIMTETLQLQGHEKVLEIGTGSGYQTAILAALADRVFSIERIRALGRAAEQRFAENKLYNVLVRIADGTHGWPEEAPYDAILVTAGAPEAPKTYLDQLKVGGRLVIPIGQRHIQTLFCYTRERNKIVKEDCGRCVFVPLIGHYGWED
ncbi:MAG: protein-L-isoaspartate(D-aspartate) O-methyltransferase [Alphaproteobacteria bacterium]